MKVVKWLTFLLLVCTATFASDEHKLARSHSDLTELNANEHVTAEALCAIGAEVFVWNRHVHAVRCRDARFKDEQANELKTLRRLRILEIAESEITVKGLRAISQLETLTKLSIASTHVKPQEYLVLSSMTNLRSVWVGSLDDNVAKRVTSDLHAELQKGLKGITRFETSHMTREGLKHLGQMTWLKELHCLTPYFTDDDLQLLSGLTELRSLLIWHTKLNGQPESKLTGQALRAFSNARGLESLEIGGIQLTEDDARFIASFKGLKRLTLSHTNISNDALRHIKNLEKLESLWVKSTSVTDDGLRYLAEMPNLKDVELPNQVSAAAALRLKEALRHRYRYAEVRR